MDSIPLIIEMLSLPAVTDFFSEHAAQYQLNALNQTVKFLKKFAFWVLVPDKWQALIESVRLTTHKVGNFVSEIVKRKAGSSKQSSSSGIDDLLKDWTEIHRLICGMIERIDFPQYIELVSDRGLSCDEIERIEKMLLETTDCSNCEALNDEKQSKVLLVKKAIPDAKHIPMELESLPRLIGYECERQPLALLLIGGLLSLKPTAYVIWKRVKDDLAKIKESNNYVTSNNMWHIINYCFEDLPYFLKLCFLYFACYPIGYEIPATSLTDIWIAEGFVTTGEGEWLAEAFHTPKEDQETKEEIANKYLEQLVQRSLVCVSKRSLLGTIKSCRVPRLIHEFAIQKSYKDEFLVANPDEEKIESMLRLAIHRDNKKQYTEIKNDYIHSFLAFNFDRNVLGSVVLIKVLELRNSTIPVTALPNMIYLKYLGLRGSNISELPKNIGDMKYLQTLDVRDTNIETLPESLWNIKNLRHVYVKPSPQIKGPPSTALIDNLYTLKTIAAHESWVENFPHFLIHLRKLALSNWDNLDWKSISNLFSHMDKLSSMAIMGKIIPSEFVDTRAFINLETVKSIKLEGEWNCRKLFIDYVQFPPNLAKLTLTKSGLKEDPMPTLEKLQALKFLSLKDGAYTGKQMVCSANGFPQLQFLKLEKLENLENWEVKPMAMSQLTTLRVVQCQKLNILPWIHFLRRVTVTDIDD